MRSLWTCPFVFLQGSPPLCAIEEVKALRDSYALFYNLIIKQRQGTVKKTAPFAFSKYNRLKKKAHILSVAAGLRGEVD